VIQELQRPYPVETHSEGSMAEDERHEAEKAMVHTWYKYYRSPCSKISEGNRQLKRTAGRRPR
jgi:hypothetical protein